MNSYEQKKKETFEKALNRLAQAVSEAKKNYDSLIEGENGKPGEMDKVACAAGLAMLCISGAANSLDREARDLLEYAQSVRKDSKASANP